MERITDTDWLSVTARELAKAKSTIIDMRGCPNSPVDGQLLSRLTERALTQVRHAPAVLSDFEGWDGRQVSSLQSGVAQNRV